jgi:hypothetical protein
MIGALNRASERRGMKPRTVEGEVEEENIIL